MASTHKVGEEFWGYLINQDDKSATPIFAQLCEGLAKIIAQLEPGPDIDLTPQRLAKFYRSVGGNDFFFRELGYPGLSLMYRTLGCFHSLQPTASAYDAPSVPCLLPAGFVRWQTLQLLLCPDEHARCMQQAVAQYDVPKPGGGNFPKTIPRESFPPKPDEAMEKWHNNVLERLDEGHSRLKNSPYCSPYEGPDRGEGYFPRSSPHMKRPSRPSRGEHHDSPHPHSASTSRRSSVPQSPVHGNNYHWSSDQAYSTPNSAIPQSPRHAPPSSTAPRRPLSQSTQRAPHLYNSDNTNGASTNDHSTKSFHLNFEKLHIPFISSPSNSKKARGRSSTSATLRGRDRRGPRSPGRYEANSTGSEASSEDSLPRIPRFERDHRRSSLAPSAESSRYQRRHSHDASYVSSPKYMPPFPRQSQPAHDDQNHNHYPYVPTAAPIPDPNPFRDDLAGNVPGASLAPESTNGAQANPMIRVMDPKGRDRSEERGRERRHNGGATLLERRAVSARRRSRSDDKTRGRSQDPAKGVDGDRLNMRRGKPLRVSTVSGKRERIPEMRSAGLPDFRRAPPIGLSSVGTR